jgi:hypothetical protein
MEIEMEIEELQEEINKRLHYAEGSSEETEYQQELKKINDSYPDEGFRIPESYTIEIKNLKIQKLKNIKRKSQNNFTNQAFLQLLQTKQTEIEDSINKKTGYLHLLTVPRQQPTIIQKIYTSITGKPNAANININEYNCKTKKTQDEINKLQTILTHINELLPIYENV